MSLSCFCLNVWGAANILVYQTYIRRLCGCSYHVTQYLMLVQQGNFTLGLTLGKVHRSACHCDRCELYQYRVVTVQHGLSCGSRRSLSGLACTSRTLSLVATASRISLLRTQPAPRLQLLGMSSFAQPAFTHRSRSLTGPPALYLLRRGIQWHLHPAQPTIASTTDWLPHRFSIRSLTGYDRGSHPYG